MRASIDTVAFNHNRGQAVLGPVHKLSSHLPRLIVKPLLVFILFILLVAGAVLLFSGFLSMPFRILFNKPVNTGKNTADKIDAHDIIGDPIGYKDRLLAEKGEQYQQFLKDLSGYKIRRLRGLLGKLNDSAMHAINCGNCANCCKTMSPVFRKSDVLRITSAIGIRPEEYYKRHLLRDENGDYVHRSIPCHFLTRDNKCMIYSIRPDDCRRFPHTSNWLRVKKQVHIQNLDKCPITLNIVEKIHGVMKAEDPST